MNKRPQGFKGLVDDLLGVAIPCFGQKVIYRSKAGGEKEIEAVFDRDFQAVDPNTESLVATNQPMIGVRTRDLPAKPCKGDRVTIEDEVFKVIDSQEDGQGGSSILLHRITDVSRKKDS